MEIDKRLFLIAFLITLIVFLGVFLGTSTMNGKREQILDDRIETLLSGYKDMQTILLLSESYGESFFCIGMKKKMEELDTFLWETGFKIEAYQEASSTFVKDESYQEQKRIFNENEVYYLSLFKNVQDKCNWTSKTVLYFYQNSEDCRDCDAQSFVLSDLKETFGDQLALFSFDMDLGLTSIEILKDYYAIEEYPCTVINEVTYCGLHTKNDLMEAICEDFSVEHCAGHQTRNVLHLSS